MIDSFFMKMRLLTTRVGTQPARVRAEKAGIERRKSYEAETTPP